MNCDCNKVLERKLAEFFKPQAGESAEASIMNIVLGIPDEGPMYEALKIPFRVKGDKKGFTSEKGKETSIHASYCPFCARNAKPGGYTVGEDQGIAAAFPSKEN